MFITRERGFLTKLRMRGGGVKEGGVGKGVTRGWGGGGGGAEGVKRVAGRIHIIPPPHGIPLMGDISFFLSFFFVS